MNLTDLTTGNKLVVLRAKDGNEYLYKLTHVPKSELQYWLTPEDERIHSQFAIDSFGLLKLVRPTAPPSFESQGNFELGDMRYFVKGDTLAKEKSAPSPIEIAKDKLSSAQYIAWGGKNYGKKHNEEAHTYKFVTDDGMDTMVIETHPDVKITHSHKQPVYEIITKEVNTSLDNLLRSVASFDFIRI